MDEITVGEINAAMKIRDIIGYALQEVSYSPGEAACWYAEGSVKWYESEDDIREISRMFPDVTFMLEGDGEDAEDFWRAYFKDGDYEYCRGKISYPDPVSIQWPPKEDKTEHPKMLDLI